MDLNEIMGFERPVEVHEDGTVTDAPDGIYAPEVYVSGGGDPDAEELRRAGWTLLSGYSGQDRYSGPVMHASEFVGGVLARDILAEPGIYVVVTVTDLDADRDAGEDDIAGWAVARKLP
jgi:hypothetical protein